MEIKKLSLFPVFFHQINLFPENGKYYCFAFGCCCFLSSRCARLLPSQLVLLISLWGPPKFVLLCLWVTAVSIIGKIIKLIYRKNWWKNTVINYGPTQYHHSINTKSIIIISFIFLLAPLFRYFSFFLIIFLDFCKFLIYENFSYKFLSIWIHFCVLNPPFLP